MNHFPTAPLTESSKKAYNGLLNRWIDIIGSKASPNTIANKPAESIKRLEESDKITHSPVNHRNYYKAILAYIKYEIKRNKTKLTPVWEGVVEKANEPINERAYTGAPTELQKDKQVDWATVEKVRDSIPLSPTKMLLAMYSYIPPQRGGDFYQLKLHTTDPKTTDGNYLILEKGKEELVMNDYKTKSRYKQIRIPLPAPLVSLIHSYWEKNSNPENVLFITPRGELFDRALFSVWTTRLLKKAFGKPTTLTVIRHAFISGLNHNKSVKEMKATATSMGHSVGQQQAYRWTPQE